MGDTGKTYNNQFIVRRKKLFVRGRIVVVSRKNVVEVVVGAASDLSRYAQTWSNN